MSKVLISILKIDVLLLELLGHSQLPKRRPLVLLHILIDFVVHKVVTVCWDEFNRWNLRFVCLSAFL